MKAPFRLLDPDEILEVTKVALKDPNRAVRMGAAMVLHDDLGIWSGKWETEVLPLMFPLLFDKSRKVRLRVATFLGHKGRRHAVPLDTAVQAIANEDVPENMPAMQRLLRGVLAAQDQE